jgi:hypothetical protein
MQGEIGGNDCRLHRASFFPLAERAHSHPGHKYSMPERLPAFVQKNLSSGSRRTGFLFLSSKGVFQGKIRMRAP